MEIPHPKEELLERLKKQMEESSHELRGIIIGNHIFLDINQKEQHYWSPQLNFRVEEHETDKKKSIVAGLIGPKPSVWTLFIFIYFFIGVSGFFLSAKGVAKLMLGEYSHWILAIPFSILLMLSAYGVGKYGEYLAKDQIEILKKFVRKAVYY